MVARARLIAANFTPSPRGGRGEGGRFGPPYYRERTYPSCGGPLVAQPCRPREIPRSDSWELCFRFSACIGTLNPPPTPTRRGAAPFGRFATRQTSLAEWYNSYQSFDLNCTDSAKAFSSGRGLPVHGEPPFAPAHA